MILPWIVSNTLADLFGNSGYNLVKDFTTEIHQWCLDNSGWEVGVDVLNAVFTGQFDYKSRYLSDLVGTTANYATIAVLAKTTGGSQAAYAVANAMARWYAQDGGPSDIIAMGSATAEFIGNAQVAGRGEPQEEDEDDVNVPTNVLERRAEWCAPAIWGTYRAGNVMHTVRPLYYSTSC